VLEDLLDLVLEAAVIEQLGEYFVSGTYIPARLDREPARAA
jgi:hypothetical protein